MPDIPVHTTAAALWPDLKLRAGLTGARNSRRGSYDRDLLAALRDALFPGQETAIDDLIDGSDLTAERLLRAFFATTKPFALMQTDILEMLSAAGARGSGESLSLSFQFDPDGEPLDLLLGEFRRQMERIAIVLASATLLPPYQDLWEIPRSGAGVYTREIEPEGATPGLTAWLADYERGVFPAMPDDWPTGREDVDARLQRVVRLADHLTDSIRAHVTGRGALMRSGLSDGPSVFGAQGGWSLADLAHIESDYWLAAAVGWLSRMRAAFRRGDEAMLQAMIEEIDRLLPSAAVRTPQLIRQLEDILDLPVWKHRHDVYAVWLGAQIFRALGAEGWSFDFHLQDGRLEFAFRGVHLASLSHCSDPEPLEWWTELQTAHDDLPSGHRKKAVKPDYRVRRSAAAGGDADLFVLEAKQHLRSSSREFADALDDYAVASPAGVVVLANHGRVSDRVLERCDPAHLDRCAALGNVHPGQPGQVQTLHRLVRRGLASALSGSPRIGGGFVSAEVRLTWGLQPRDLDLHVRRTGNEDESVYYGQLTAPGLQHHGDVTTGRGPELVTIDDPEGALLVMVRQYTPEGTLGDSGARIEIRAKAQDGREVRFTFEPPADLAGSEWPVARLDMSLGSVVGAGGGDLTS